MSKIQVAQIGLGRWGKNILRNLAALPEGNLRYACDANAEQLKLHQASYPNLKFIADPQIIFDDPEIQAVVISSPVSTHFDLASKALKAGKHVFVEKPIVLLEAELAELAKLAEQKKLIIMEGHLLLYHPAIIELKAAITNGLIGELEHLTFRRTSLGAIRLEANVLWDVGPHDLSVLLFLLDGQMPETVKATGCGNLEGKAHAEVVFTSLKYASGLVAHIHESWRDPFKERKIMVVGSKAMLVLDEHATDGKLKLVKKTIIDTKSKIEHERFIYEDKGIEVLNIPESEPLKSEMQHFLDCVKTGQPALSGPQNSQRVLKLLHLAQASLEA